MSAPTGLRCDCDCSSASTFLSQFFWCAKRACSRSSSALPSNPIRSYASAMRSYAGANSISLRTQYAGGSRPAMLAPPSAVVIQCRNENGRRPAAAAAVNLPRLWLGPRRDMVDYGPGDIHGQVEGDGTVSPCTHVQRVLEDSVKHRLGVSHMLRWAREFGKRRTIVWAALNRP